MSIDKATPRPWKREGKTVYALEHDRYSGGIELLRNRFDCQIQGRYSTPREELEANAALIIRAVNLFDELVSCLDDEIKFAQTFPGYHPAEKTNEILSQAKAQED
jgi:hypothetical protein